MVEGRIGRVLVVEDEAELRFILQAHLRAAGFEAFEATNGREAIEVALERQPDLIIMDVVLPTMDGIDATRALKGDERTAHIPVIMLTGRSAAADVVRGLEAGAQEYVCKPFELTELMARVRTVHRLAQARHSLNQLNSRLEEEVDVKTRRLQILYEFMQNLNRADTRDAILDLVIEATAQITGAQRISLLLSNESRENLKCVRAVGIDPAIVEQIEVKAIEGIAGQVFRSGKTLAAKTVGLGPESDREYLGDAFLSTPLLTKLETREGVLGVLNVTDKTDNAPFGDEEIDCIRSIADAGAIALDNATRQERLQQSVQVLLHTVGHLAEYRDEETTQHLARVSKMAQILARELNREGPYASLVTEAFIESLVQAAPMHDIGKVGIPDDILTKPGALTNEEFRIMKTHTEIGRCVLSQALDPAHPVPLVEMCIDIAYCHHERYNGGGYPRQIRGADIPLAARIVALVDAYDAITSKRRYKAAKSHADALKIIRAESGKHFDPVIVQAFLRCATEFDKVRARLEEPVEALEPVLV